MNRKVLGLGLLLVLPLLAMLASGLRHDPHEVISPLIGRPAPDFTLADLDGRPLALSEMRGQPLVINFWATWCQPCAAENPIFAALATRYAGRARFVSVIYQDTPEAIRAYERERGSWGPALVDPESRTAIRYGVYGVPETFVVDARGVVHDKITGQISFGGLVRSLDSALAATTEGRL